MEGKDNSKESNANSRENEGIRPGSTIIQLPSPSILKPLKSICKIDTSESISTGFFIKFFKGEKDFFCLMTNKHVITSKLIKERKTINVYYDYESKVKEIKLNPEERFIKEFNTELNIDVTVVEILSADDIEQDYFLLPSIGYMYNFNNLLNKEITIIQYPLGGNQSYSNGSIEKIDQYEFTHSAPTLSGSSGSPVFVKDNIGVIGIHKARKRDNSENYGDFIGPIFNYIKNELKYKIILDDGDYYIGELKNNMKNGKGIIYYKNGNIKYDGDFVNDKFEGKGKYTMENGDYYIGEWKNNMKNGQGKFFINIRIYKGKEYHDELVFEGVYFNDQKWNGKGKEYRSDGILLFEGEYLKGKRNGKGKEYNLFGGLIFEGEYINGKRWNGKGKEYKHEYIGELLFIGEYFNGKRWNGKGIEYTWKNKLKFKGEYLNGERWNGKGKEYTWNGKLLFEIEYLNGVGKGKEYNYDGELVFEGEYLKGEKWNGK